MDVKKDLGVFLFILITGAVLSRFISSFIDVVSALYILGGALSFAEHCPSLCLWAEPGTPRKGSRLRLRVPSFVDGWGH